MYERDEERWFDEAKGLKKKPGRSKAEVEDSKLIFISGIFSFLISFLAVLIGVLISSGR